MAESAMKFRAQTGSLKAFCLLTHFLERESGDVSCIRLQPDAEDKKRFWLDVTHALDAYDFEWHFRAFVELDDEIQTDAADSILLDWEWLRDYATDPLHISLAKSEGGEPEDAWLQDAPIPRYDYHYFMDFETTPDDLQGRWIEAFKCPRMPFDNIADLPLIPPNFHVGVPECRTLLISLEACRALAKDADVDFLFKPQGDSGWSLTVFAKTEKFCFARDIPVQGILSTTRRTPHHFRLPVWYLSIWNVLLSAPRQDRLHGVSLGFDDSDRPATDDSAQYVTLYSRVVSLTQRVKSADRGRDIPQQMRVILDTPPQSRFTVEVEELLRRMKEEAADGRATDILALVPEAGEDLLLRLEQPRTEPRLLGNVLRAVEKSGRIPLDQGFYLTLLSIAWRLSVKQAVLTDTREFVTLEDCSTRLLLAAGKPAAAITNGIDKND